jgi:hypothetical protein
LALDAGDGVGAMVDDTALYTSIGGLVVASLSLVVSIVSIVNARHAKQLARQGAMLGQRSEAIKYLREALFDFKRNRAATSEVLQKIGEAKALADVVFSKTVRADLDRAPEIARARFSARRPLLEIERDVDAFQTLQKDLCNLIEQMKQEAAL